MCVLILSLLLSVLLSRDDRSLFLTVYWFVRCFFFSCSGFCVWFDIRRHVYCLLSRTLGSQVSVADATVLVIRKNHHSFAFTWKRAKIYSKHERETRIERKQMTTTTKSVWLRIAAAQSKQQSNYNVVRCVCFLIRRETKYFVVFWSEMTKTTRNKKKNNRIIQWKEDKKTTNNRLHDTRISKHNSIIVSFPTKKMYSEIGWFWLFLNLKYIQTYLILLPFLLSYFFLCIHFVVAHRIKQVYARSFLRSFLFIFFLSFCWLFAFIFFYPKTKLIYIIVCSVESVFGEKLI